MYELVVESEFSAAHRLRGYQGECEKLHGHNWRVELVVNGRELNSIGVLVDFRDLKRILTEVISELDHQYLNDLEAFREQNPTTENLARVVYRAVAERLPPGLRVSSVAVWESPRCCARYSG